MYQCLPLYHGYLGQSNAEKIIDELVANEGMHFF
jgi:hypothetical protein